MLRTRILTATILVGILLAVLFLLSPPWVVLAIGAVFTTGAWEWSGFGAMRGTLRRAVYAASIALLMILTWWWTADRAHLILLLGAACLWWVIALLWLSFAPSRQHSTLALSAETTMPIARTTNSPGTTGASRLRRSAAFMQDRWRHEQEAAH